MIKANLPNAFASKCLLANLPSKLRQFTASGLAKLLFTFFCLLLIVHSYGINSDIVYHGLDNRFYETAFNCADYDKESLAIGYACFARSQGSFAPGLFSLYMFFNRIGISYPESCLILALTFVASFAYALRNSRTSLFLILLLVGSFGYYSTYIIWSSHKQQLSLILFFIFWGLLPVASNPYNNIKLLILSLLGILAHPQQAIQLFASFIYSHIHAVNNNKYYALKAAFSNRLVIPTSFIRIGAILLPFLAITLYFSFNKLIGYNTYSSMGHTLGTIFVAQFPFAMLIVAKDKRYQVFFLFIFLVQLIAPFTIGASRSTTLLYYLLLLVFGSIYGKGKFVDAKLPLASLVALAAFDLARGVIANITGEV